MLQVDGKDFSAVFKSLPQWLGEPPTVTYLVFDGRKLVVRALTALCLLEYVFSGVKYSKDQEPFTAGVDHDIMASAFKGQSEITWQVSNKTLAYKAGRYKGQSVLSEVRDLHFPSVPKTPPQTWVSNLLHGSDNVLLKKKISTVTPLTVFFRQTQDRTSLCTADGIHFIMAEIATPSMSNADVAIPYSSFQLMMAAFKKSTVPPEAYVSESHMIVKDDRMTLFVPLLGEAEVSGMTLDAINNLVAATKAEHVAHVQLTSQLDLLAAFVDRGKSLKEKSEESAPILNLKVKENGLFCRFETSRGFMEDHIAGTTKKGTPGTEINVDPIAFMDVLTTMAAPNVSFLFMPEGRRLGVIGHRDKHTLQTGMVIGMNARSE